MGELDVRTNDCVSMKFMLEVFETKYTDHVEKKIKGLPEQDDIVLKAAVNLFSDVGEEKRVSYKQLFDETESECKIACRENISRNAFYHVMTELEFYSLIKLFPN
jgi:Cdc6-like AAA superfamily ATPase